MRAASTGLIARRSRRVILDEIKADLRRYFESAGLAIFDIAARHAACGYDLAVAMREALEHVGVDGDREWIARFASRAVTWEARADQLLNEARDYAKRFQRPASLIDFLEYADDAVDEMEEAASLADLCALLSPQDIPVGELRRLADMAVGSAQNWSKPSNARPPSREPTSATISTISFRLWSASSPSSIRPTSKFACYGGGSFLRFKNLGPCTS